jgi:YHS domain-containing protein
MRYWKGIFMHNQIIAVFITITVLATSSMSGIPQPTVEVSVEGMVVQDVENEPRRNTEEWNLSRKSLGVKGYDLVSYFPEGGSKPSKGSKKYTHSHKGVEYRFKNQHNLNRFLEQPAKYEPAFGGWCAWAMARNSKTDINPKAYIIRDGRLLLFYNGLLGNTKNDWKKGIHNSLLRSADASWGEISGEAPRIWVPEDEG